MRKALRNHQAWLSSPDGRGILVCLRTGRILATVTRGNVGWMSRIFVSPVRLFWMWRHRVLGKPAYKAVEFSRTGPCFVVRHLDYQAVCQDAEFWSDET